MEVLLTLIAEHFWIILLVIVLALYNKKMASVLILAQILTPRYINIAAVLMVLVAVLTSDIYAGVSSGINK